MGVETIEQAIASAKSGAYRIVEMKRRLATTGLFESSWQDISSDVKKWGSIKINAEGDRLGTYTLDGVRMVFQNDEGRYNPDDDEGSLWSGYLNQQRTLVRIRAGLYHQTQSANGIWNRRYFPGSANWDEGHWDVDPWDSSDQIFIGIIAGELLLGDNNEVTIPIKPLTQVFRDFPAAALTGLNNSLTASGFIRLLRDQTDGAGSFIFRPFFGDTTSNWDIQSTTNIYADLSTVTSQEIVNSSVWDVIEKLAEAENYAAYVDPSGVFHFAPKSATTTVAFEFHGLGSFNSTYGHTIKKIERFGKDFSKYYSRVVVKYRPEDTATSYVATMGSFSVSGTNQRWALGFKTLELENFWIADLTAASSIVNALFTEFSQLKDVIEFRTSFIPHLDILDRISVSYDASSRGDGPELWDVNDWDTELTWDDSTGDAIRLDGAEFKFLTMEINLDALECKFKARQI